MRITTDDLGVVAFRLRDYPNAIFDVEDDYDGGYTLTLVTSDDLEQERLDALRPRTKEQLEAEATFDALLDDIARRLGGARRTA